MTSGASDIAEYGQALGQILRDLSYDEGHIKARLGTPNPLMSPSALELARRRLDDDSLGLALRFYYLGLEIDATAAKSLLTPIGLDEAAASGLIRRIGDSVAAGIRIAPFGGAIVAHDFERGGALAVDHVLGIGAATRTLAALTPRSPVGRALDIGTGGGAQAMLLASHADHVIGTDLNDRAVMLARLSAALNGTANIEIRAGDAFGPVSGERFDLIVANPPFVISPDHELTFRDGTMGGDEMSATIVRDAARHLTEGGTAVVLANWIVDDSTGEVVAPKHWTADLDCDSLILHHDTLEPLAYAERWMLVPPTAGPATFAATLERWLLYYETVGARGIASGAIILRKTGSPARQRVLDMPKRPSDGSEHVERLLAAFDPITGVDDPQILASAFALVEPHELLQRLSYQAGEYQAGDAVLRLRRSAGVVARVPADLLEALFVLDGDRPLGAILDDLATRRDEPAEELRSRAVPAFLDLFERGLLTR